MLIGYVIYQTYVNLCLWLQQYGVSHKASMMLRPLFNSLRILKAFCFIKLTEHTFPLSFTSNIWCIISCHVNNSHHVMYSLTFNVWSEHAKEIWLPHWPLPLFESHILMIFPSSYSPQSPSPKHPLLNKPFGTERVNNHYPWMLNATKLAMCFIV